jgi:hypothetical protein
MKKVLVIAIAGLIGLAGCDTRSTPGGPGATTPKRSTDVGLGQAENTFELDPPNTQTTIEQGQTKTITLGIDRGKNFSQDVKLDFSNVPPGVTITPPADGTLKASEKEVQVTIAAAKDAALGEHTITVTGTPAREGPKATNTFKIQVNKPD